MARFFGAVLCMILVLVALGFVLAHIGVVIVIMIAFGLLGRRLRRHGV